MASWRKQIFVTLFFLAACSSKTYKPDEAAREIPVDPSKPVNFAVALGGGGFRGYIHIGVIKALEEAGLKPDLITGTSIGSLVGALWASGLTSKEILDLLTKIEKDEPYDFTFFSSGGWIQGIAFENTVRKYLPIQKIQDFKISFLAISAKLESGQAVAFNSGDAAQAIRASSSYPGVFLPAIIENEKYVDGFAVSPVPVESAVSRNAKVILAVDISPALTPLKQTSAVANLERSNEILLNLFIEKQGQLATVFIRPYKNKVFDYKQIPNRNDLVEIGYQAALKVIQQLQDSLKQPIGSVIEQETP